MPEERTPASDDAEHALDVLRSGRRFLLVGHVRPDGDCLGAQAALARMLVALGKGVTIMNPDEPAPTFDFLAEAARFEAFGGRLPEHDVCVLLDINDLSRCGDMTEPLRAAPSAKLVVDHHPYLGQPWWDAAFLDPSASATGVLVWRIGRRLEVPVDRGIALAVFTSLVTDTGWFKYSNTDAETMAVAAELVAAGVDPNTVYGSIYQRNDPREPLALARLLERVEYFGDGRIAVVDQPRPANGDAVLADSDLALDVLRAVGRVEVVLYVKELEGGACKLSARSKSDYDVNALARRFGGGGHVKASGATIEGSLDDVRRRLVEAALEGLARREEQTSEAG